MTITTNYLERKWNSFTYYEGGFIRLDIPHSLEWYIGYQSIDRKTLMIVTNCETIAPSSSKSVIVSKRLRKTDGKWTLTFELIRDEQEGVFINLCCDIFNFSQSATTQIEGLNCVLKRYKQWNHLLEYQRKNILDDRSTKGLLGELIFLQNKLRQGINHLSVVQAWVGPDGGDQDFTFAKEWYEVKTIGIGADSVSISSLEQLDNSEIGNLTIIRVDKCAPERHGAISLFQKVTEIRDILNEDSDAKALFELKLAKYGYIDLPEYDSQKYFCSGEKTYIVNETFPKLISSNIPSQVIASQYKLSIAGIKAWEL